ncbi:transposase [Corallococcus sp. Z5C101001]|nr:transposase [Corallococcus sp. Z5C101001]
MHARVHRPDASLNASQHVVGRTDTAIPHGTSLAGRIPMTEELLVHAEGAAFIADTGYDADRIRTNVRKLRMKPVIHSNPSRKWALPLDRTLYRLRYRVECFFHDLKRFRAVATRYDKTAISYLAVLHVASMLLWLR